MIVACWSGPRNISTALMRSWSSRKDTYVTDEPFYAYYLKETQINHPMHEKIINRYLSDYDEIVDYLINKVPNQKHIWYQKHMAHHIFKYSDLSWIKHVTNLFLVRDPKEVIVSYQKRFPLTSHLQLGYSQQVKIAKTVADFTGDFPIVINAKDVLMNPKKVIMMLCDMISIDFEEEMLSWPSGKRDSDGVWAPHWYSEVEKTTAFQPYLQRNVVLNSKWKDIYDSCMADYEFLNSSRMKVA